MEDDPFPDLHITNSDFMNDVDSREICSKCGKSRRYYCYTCFVPMKSVEKNIPNVKLPVKVDIIKHPNEISGKSTAAHAAVLAPGDVTVHVYPTIPHYDKKERVLLVYPSETSITFEEYVNMHAKTHIEGKQTLIETLSDTDTDEISKKHSISRCRKRLLNDQALESHCCTTCSDSKAKKAKTDCTELYPFDRVLFIDSTWHQVKKIAGDERLQGLQTIELKTRETKFWRHQRDKPNTYLATIEAIYYFLREFHHHFISTAYQGEYDDMLFLFCFMYHKIKVLYDGGKDIKAYQKQS